MLLCWPDHLTAVLNTITVSTAAPYTQGTQFAWGINSREGGGGAPSQLQKKKKDVMRHSHICARNRSNLMFAAECNWSWSKTDLSQQPSLKWIKMHYIKQGNN